LSVVIDAGVVVALIVADDRQDAVRNQLQQWIEARETLHAPAVLAYEIANVLARLVFDDELNIDDVDGIWDDLAAMDLALHPFDLADDGPEVAAITASLHRRHATDSTYIALARRLGTVVWTLDGALARNAADHGLPVRLVA
jgi:predicted nucleic acid-binding protein